MRRIALALAILACLGQSRDGIKRPEFLKTHSIYSENSEMLIQVRVTPHPDIRTVLLEAWELEDDADEDPLAGNDIFSEFVVRPSPLSRKRLVDMPNSASVQDAWPEQAIYRFLWRAGLHYGKYELVAKLYLGRGIHVESTPKVILVR